MEREKKGNPGKLLIVLIVLAVLLPAAAAACVMVTADSYNQAPQAHIISILPHNVMPGDNVVFRGRGVDPDGYITEYSWRSDMDGFLSESADFSTDTLSQGLHTIYFQVKDSSGVWSGEVRQRVKVGPASPPPQQNNAGPAIVTFQADPSGIQPGGTAVLKWKVTGASQVTISGGIGDVPPQGNKVVSPAVTTTYTLTAINANGPVAQPVTVTVAAVAPDNTPPTVPVLLSPAQNAVLPQPVNPWSFDWADSADPESGIKQYQIYVKLGTMPNAAIDELVAGSEYSETSGGSVPQANCQGWTWKVRAQNNAGLWSQWSQPRAFSVQPPPAASTTEVITAVSGEGGYITDAGTVFTGALIAGDDVTDMSYQAFISFDISGIPVGATIQDVTVDFDGDHLVFGDPFNDLGCLRAYVDDYGVLDAGDYFNGAPLGAVLRYCTEAELAVPSSESDIRDALQARLGHSRFQMRIQYNETATDGDGQADFIVWLLTQLPELTVTYTQ